jgi:predicted DCC family thiol-disulfide oxidoreductase YuxK
MRIGKEKDDISTVVLIKSLTKDNAGSVDVYYRSDAVLQVVEQLGVAGSVAANVLTNLPLLTRDKIYNGVATNRYNILGQKKECRCSDPVYADRFL